MRIVIFGAGGRTGSAAVAEATARGHRVTSGTLRRQRRTGWNGWGGTPMPHLAHRVGLTGGCHVRRGSYRPLRTKLRYRAKEGAMVFVGVHEDGVLIRMARGCQSCSVSSNVQTRDLSVVASSSGGGKIGI